MKKTGKNIDTRSEAALETITDARRHTECFAQAMKLFNAGEFAQARESFERAQQGPVLSVNESALMYRRICEQRLERQRLEAASAEEQTQQGLSLLKQERYSEALPVLESALQLGADSAALRYALALAAGSLGDAAAAARHLLKADAPARTRARSDARFRNLMQFAEIRDALTERE